MSKKGTKGGPSKSSRKAIPRGVTRSKDGKLRKR